MREWLLRGLRHWPSTLPALAVACAMLAAHLAGVETLARLTAEARAALELATAVGAVVGVLWRKA